MSRHTLFTSAWLLAGLTLVACAEQPAIVSFDFSALAAQRDDLNMPLDRLTIVARPDTYVPTEDDWEEVEGSIDELTFEMEIPAGRWLIEATGERSDLSEPVATYFGDYHLEAAPLDIIDLSIPMFPAGEIDITIEGTADASFDLPEEALIRFTHEEPLADMADGYTMKLADGTYNRALPAGPYSLRAEFSFDGTNYESSAEVVELTIRQGERWVEVYGF